MALKVTVDRCTICKYAENHGVVHLERGNCTVYELYISIKLLQRRKEIPPDLCQHQEGHVSRTWPMPGSSGDTKHSTDHLDSQCLT